MCKSSVNRWFYRCLDCLSVVATEQSPMIDRRTGRGSEVCGLCGGGMESMGRVERDRLVTDSERCACDDRCTYATGPKCNCKCGGENHGTKRTVAVRVDHGVFPVLCVPDSSKARQIAEEWRSALVPVLAVRDAIISRKNAGWIPRSDYDRMMDLCRIVSRARAARTHAGRMKILNAAMVSA